MRVEAQNRHRGRWRTLPQPGIRPLDLAAQDRGRVLWDDGIDVESTPAFEAGDLGELRRDLKVPVIRDPVVVAGGPDSRASQPAQSFRADGEGRVFARLGAHRSHGLHGSYHTYR